MKIEAARSKSGKLEFNRIYVGISVTAVSTDAREMVSLDLSDVLPVAGRELPAEGRSMAQNLGQKVACAFTFWMAKKLGGIVLFDDLAFVHENDPVSD